MIDIDRLSMTFDGADSPALHVPHLHVDEGELVLVVGPTGSGKSTLLSALNGLVPHFSGGTLAGRVMVDGHDTATHRPRDLAEVVGHVPQNPVASFVTDTVEDEIAYGMEVLGVEPGVMRRRVEEILDVLGLADVRSRRLLELSGGQQQRVAIAAVLAAGPRILVLDEPTSALDPVAAEDVLAALARLVDDMALTVVLAEHRLERVIHHADRVVLVDAGRVSDALSPAQAMALSPIHPPVVGLGRLMGWSPLPLSVREARRAAGEIRTSLASSASPADSVESSPSETTADDRPRLLGRLRGRRDDALPVHARLTTLEIVRGGTRAVRDLDLDLPPGGITVLMGRNGSGKSTLLWALAGQLAPRRGQIRIADPQGMLVDPARLAPRDRIRHVGLVPQDPTALLYAESVAAECAQADADMGAEPGTTATVFARIAGQVDPSHHPRDLSEGQRLALALAIILAGSPPLLLLDEPTRGLDYAAKARLVTILTEMAEQGRTIVVATHDVELAAEIADRVVLMADGNVVADDDSALVLAGSTAYAPQISRVLHPLPLLSVQDVVRALRGRA